MLTAGQSARVDVVLVSPRNPLNIGAAARAMANFGFQHLLIVAPFAHNWMEAKSAVGAPDLLRDAKVYDTLAEAVAHATLVLGTGSLDRRKPEQVVLGLPEAASQIRAALNRIHSQSAISDEQFAIPAGQPAILDEQFAIVDGHRAIGDVHRAIADTGSVSNKTLDAEASSARVALVFGSEKHGLTTDDLSWCHAIAVIDTHDAQPSMNLGQAVAVCLYEISRTSETASPSAQPIAIQPLGSATGALANSAQLDRLAALVEETMEAVKYATRGMRSANGEALRVLLRRLMPNDADLRRMMGLFRRILWQLARNRESPRDKV